MGLILSEPIKKVVEILKILAKMSVEDATIHPKRPYKPKGARSFCLNTFFLCSWAWFRVLNNHLDKKQIKQRQLMAPVRRASAFFERSARQLDAGCGGQGPS
jgi:hypothetical protein